MGRRHSPEAERSHLCGGDRQKDPLEEYKTRSDAITLIRARTLTRLSPTESLSSLSPGDTSSQSSDQYHSSSGQSVNLDLDLDLPPAITMKPVSESRKKKKNPKNGQKKSDDQEISSVKNNTGPTDKPEPRQGPSTHVSKTLSSTQIQTKKAIVYHNSSTLSLEQMPPIPVPPVQVQGLQSSATPSETQSTGGTGTCSLTTLNVHKGKGKRRVPKVDGNTSGETTEAMSENAQKIETESNKSQENLSLPQLSSQTERQKPNISFRNGPKTAEETSTQISNPNPESTTTVSPSENSADSENAGIVSSSQLSRPYQNTRKAVIPTRERLPSIQEISIEITQNQLRKNGHPSSVEQEGESNKTQSPFAHTPKTSSPTSTGSIIQKPYIIPQATASSQTSYSHAHPSCSIASAQSTQSTPNMQGTISSQKSEGFFWQLDSHGFPCAKADCDRRCNLWDDATVICPKCGPFSEVRYCRKEHLLDDIKWHWLYCGQMTFTHPCRETSIPWDVRNGPPLVPCLHSYDTPERHRQAVYFNVNSQEGDYFIFSDWTDFVEAGFPEDNLGVRCSNRVVYAVKFDDPEEKDRFRRVLAACLFMTLELHGLIDYLFRLIRDSLRSQAVWSSELETTLQYQIHEEFAVAIQPDITGERHACNTDWDGRNRRHCQDTICRAEYRRLLGSPGVRGHRQLIDHLEGSFWILRAVRTTHPEIAKAEARMRGEGFEEVAEEDRRMFRRGPGWDGAGTGDMEIEGING